MIKMELVSNPNNVEESFVRVEIDNDVTVYKHAREFEVTVVGSTKQVTPRPIPFYQVGE
jgi:hypothetical protein